MYTSKMVKNSIMYSHYWTNSHIALNDALKDFAISFPIITIEIISMS
jgi:hypothetical protein